MTETTTAQAINSRDTPRGGVQRPGLTTILVASDGTDTSLPALAAAKWLAASDANVHVVTVLEPTAMSLSASELPVCNPALDAEEGQRLLRQVRHQAERTFGKVHAATVALRIGSRIGELVHAAHECRATLVITGIRHHGRMERVLLHRETPLGLARRGGIRVLAVPHAMEWPPRVVLVALDLDDASAHAAHLARPFLKDAEKVLLLHVLAVTGDAAAGSRAHEHEQWLRAHQQQDVVKEALALPRSVEVESVVARGDPVEEILDLAAFVGADLIVAGSNRRHLLGERHHGPRRVAERVLRATTCAMLLVPSAARDVDAMLDVETEVVPERSEWPAALARFARHNSGRRCRLELDTLDLGTQGQVSGMPLLDAGYDADADVVDLLFGGADDGFAHLAHRIPKPSSVERLHLTGGADLALRVSHQGGYSLLTFD